MQSSQMADQEDSLLQLINAKIESDPVEAPPRLEKFTDEGDKTFEGKYLRPKECDAIKLSENERQLIAFATFMMGLSPR